MRCSRRVIVVLIVTCCASGSSLQAQTSTPKKDAAAAAGSQGTQAGAAAQTSTLKQEAAAPATIVRPLQLELLSLQVSKLPRNEFGHGIKPGTNEQAMSWLANSGTAVDLRLKLDRPIARFDGSASRLIRFADDKGSDLTTPLGGEQVAINSFFPDNQPIRVKIGPTWDEAEVIVQGFGTPAPGATKLQIQADLVFRADSGKRTIERQGLDPKPGTKATIGPLHLTCKDPEQVVLPRPPMGVRPPFPLPGPRPPFSDPDQARAPFESLRRGGGGESTRVAFEYERVDRSIQSVTCLDPEGEVVATFDSKSAAFPFVVGRGGGTVIFSLPKPTRFGVRVIYFERSETLTVPLRLETGVGF